jgi:alpha-tubulin suppressor-like RCC1 family protein
LCWGWNEHGQLGSNSRETSRPPGLVGGLVDVSAVVAGGHHSCALSAGQVYCWGQNQGGQLGTGDEVDRNAPIAVQNLPEQIDQIEVGYYHSCALDSSGVMWCWGYNEQGQVGDGSWIDRSTPQRAWSL